MESFSIANIIIDDNSAFHTAPTLYVRSTCTVVPGDGSTSFSTLGPGTSDFTTFFNALSVGKWRAYTVAEEFVLHLELRGAACAYVQTHAERLDVEARRVEGTRREIPASGGWRAVDIPLVVGARDVLVGFALEAAGPVELRRSHYAAEVGPEQVRPVELAVATTTFRKEGYVTGNARLVRERVMGSGERAAGHVTMHVVDNGRTLDAGRVAGGGVHVHPNPNAGGAGGFARGMMEALAQDPPATHVLLMDDDVAVSPESILRTWNLLSLVRDEWADAFVAGAMMSWDRPDLLWEDGGYMTSAGHCDILKYHMNDHISPREFPRMSAVRGIVGNETYRPLTRSYADFEQRYAAWWYCCIPAETIRREGLPLPLFVRYDDVEYSLRCKPRFMTMNGICIWHLDFSLRYNAAVEHYQTTRNGLIIQAASDVAPLSDFEGQLVERTMIELTKFNYTDAELILDGLEDYLKGPGFFAAPGMAEQTYLAANKRREQLLPYEELRELALAQTGVDIADYDPNDILQDYPLGLTPHGSPFRVSRMQTFKRTINGQLYGKLKPYAGPVAVINANLNWPVGRIYGVDTVIAIDVPSKRGVVRHRDNERCKAIWKRLQTTLKEYHASKDELRALYRQARPTLTSERFWREYLDEHDDGPRD